MSIELRSARALVFTPPVVPNRCERVGQILHLASTDR